MKRYLESTDRDDKKKEFRLSNEENKKPQVTLQKFREILMDVDLAERRYNWSKVEIGPRLQNMTSDENIVRKLIL